MVYGFYAWIYALPSYLQDTLYLGAGSDSKSFLFLGISFQYNLNIKFLDSIELLRRFYGNINV